MSEIYRWAWEALQPPAALRVSEWADKHRVLSPRAAAETGPWRTSRTPYLREIMDSLSASSGVSRVVFMKGAQVGATEAGNNWLGYIIDHAPGPCLFVMPTVEMARRNSRTRVDSLIQDSPRLKELVGPGRGRRGQTVLGKEFPGGVVVMTGANSAVGLRSMPARYLFLDEVDGYPGDLDGEGDPVALAERAARTYARRKVFIVSTPTITGQSRIEREYDATDKRRYFVPCPACGAFQTLEFAQLRWPKGKPGECRYVCVHCKESLGDEHKTEMLTRGEWRATVEGTDPRTRGYHLSSLYSPVGWHSWVEIAAAWEAAQGFPEKLKTVVNTMLGETWRERGEAPPWQKLYDRREPWELGTVPWGGLFLTAGVDVQKDRIEVRVWAWGRRKISWLVDVRILLGLTAEEAVWDELTEVIEGRWGHESGLRFQLSKVAIDSGFATTEVYAWAAKQAPGLVMVVKGVQRGASMVGLPTKISVSPTGKPLKRSARVWPISVGWIKGETFRWLNLDRPTDEALTRGEIYPAGYVHLPVGVGEDEVKQLTAEQLVTKKDKRGFSRQEWQLLGRNEALDCRVYARAAASLFGMDRWDDAQWAELEAPIPQQEEEAAPAAPIMPGSPDDGMRPSPVPPPPPADAAPRRRGTWIPRRPGGWINR